MSVTAVPTLEVAGLTVPGPELVAVDALRISWGRATVLEQPTAATAALTLSDRSARAAFARRLDLIGQPIVLGWECSDGSSGINFRGRITDVAAAPRRKGAPAGGGFRVAIAASSVEVDLANYKTPEGTVYPGETFAARRARIAGLLPMGTFIGGVELPDRFDLGLQQSIAVDTDLDTYWAAQVDAGGKTALELLRELFASTSPLPMVYDPALDKLRFAPRRRFAYLQQQGLTMSASLSPSPEHGGRYVAMSLGGQHLDAALTGYSGALGQAIDSRITRVEVEFPDSTNNYASRTIIADTTSTAAELFLGRRTLSVQTIQSDPTKAAQLAKLYADVANRESRTPRLGSIGYSSKREPFHNAAHAATLLAGHETGAALFLRRSWLPQLGERPLVGILGATITYAPGEWSVDLNPAPVVLDASESWTGLWQPITCGALQYAEPVTLAQLDPSVTVGDLAFVDIGPGLDLMTASPYVGNPLP
jgi:hypothetical protein